MKQGKHFLLNLRRNGTPPLFDVLPFEVNNENYFLLIGIICTLFGNFNSNIYFPWHAVQVQTQAGPVGYLFKNLQGKRSTLYHNYLRFHSKSKEQRKGGPILQTPLPAGSSTVRSPFNDQTGNILHPVYTQAQNIT